MGHLLNDVFCLQYQLINKCFWISIAPIMVLGSVSPGRAVLLSDLGGDPLVGMFNSELQVLLLMDPQVLRMCSVDENSGNV